MTIKELKERIKDIPDDYKIHPHITTNKKSIFLKVADIQTYPDKYVGILMELE